MKGKRLMMNNDKRLILYKQLGLTKDSLEKLINIGSYLKPIEEHKGIPTSKRKMKWGINDE